jgi:hypothetical protein
MDVHLEEKVNKQHWNLIEMFQTECEGVGVRSLCDIEPGRIVCNYGGQLLTEIEGETISVDDKENWKFLFQLDLFVNSKKQTFFLTCNKCYDTPTLGQLLNHSQRHPNVCSKLYVDRNGKPDVLFRTIKKIRNGEELCWNYGDEYPNLSKCLSSCRLCKFFECGYCTRKDFKSSNARSVHQKTCVEALERRATKRPRVQLEKNTMVL